MRTRNFVTALAAGATLLAGPSLAAAAMAATTSHPQVVRSCRSEDSPGPCYWNAARRGNGKGTSFFRDRAGHVHYLRTPLRGFQAAGWHRLPSAMIDALREGQYGQNEPWGKCMEHVGGTTYVVCPDGFEMTS